MRLRTAIVATGLALVVSALEAQSIDPALTAAIAARDQAGIASDRVGMAKYTADDYASINPSGTLMNKKQRVDGLTPAAPGSKPSPPLRTEAVRMYGPDAAVVRMKGATNRQLSVWIKNASGWQAETVHVVPDAFVPQAAPVARPKTAAPSNVPAQSGLTGDRAAVYAAFTQLQDAYFAGNRAAWEKGHAPEHVRLMPGMIRFANEFSSLIDGPRTPPAYANVSVQLWGPLGVVRWHETNAAGLQTWLTRVFAKNGSGWQSVATASSLAGNPAITP